MDIFPTENIDKIKQICNLFTELDNFDDLIHEKNEYKEIRFIIEGIEGLKFLFSQVRKQKIVEAVRGHVYNFINVDMNRCSFILNKQALTMGKVGLCYNSDESPLGPVRITISANHIESVINYLFPPTENGQVLEAENPILE